MNRVAVVFWSGTGNTEAMAGAVARGSSGTLFTASEFDAGKVSEYHAIAFGCPSMGAEQLEDGEFKPMFEACKPQLKGKRIALFGSYGWGDGEWMRNWEADCDAIGADRIGESVICLETPDDAALADCEALGRALAEAQ